MTMTPATRDDAATADAPLIFTPEYYTRMRELEASGWWNAGMRRIAEMLLDEADLPSNGNMLDVGCGSGQTMTWFATRWRGWRTIGLDVAPEGLTAARALGERVMRASALDLPLPPRSVNAIVTLDVLQHLPLDGGDLRALAEMRRVLAPQGILFIRTNAQSVPHAPDDPEHMFHKYEPDELRLKLERAGFDVLRIGRVNALLGLAEIPREWRAQRDMQRGYHGILAAPRARRSPIDMAKRAWLTLEGRALRAGWSLPMGRTLFALCRRREIA